MFDVTALGEILIDFTPAPLSEQGNICFERNPGGAPANVLACISKLGGKTAFIGKVGKDMFGTYLKEILNTHGIDSTGLKVSSEANTTLAFVQLDSLGDRSFSFYRNPGADTTLHADEIPYSIIKKSKVFHFGSLSLTNEPSKTATLAALDSAVKNGCIVSYDPNYRAPLWESEKKAITEIKSVLHFADILKISEEELELITTEANLEKGTEILGKEFKIPLVLVTLGANGCFYRFRDKTGKQPTFDKLKTIDTTGAGDAFLGGFLYSMLSREIRSPRDLKQRDLEEMLVFSNAVASLCTTRKGAIPAMPDMDTVKELIAQYPTE